jgi:triosephosphate isomerase
MDKNRESVIAGNWKMNILPSEVHSFARGLRGVSLGGITSVVCPSYVCLTDAVRELSPLGIAVGAQDVSAHTHGAYTGDVSGEQLVDIGVKYVIIGHSERRRGHFETDGDANAKVRAAVDIGLRPIICVGESLETRRGGGTKRVLSDSTRSAIDGMDGDTLTGIIFAYEPIWAIGTGISASPDDAQDGCRVIREVLAQCVGDALSGKIPILYGGSMGDTNARELLEKPDIDGGLIGGKSLDPAAFADIIKTAKSVKLAL